ncbi:MAG: formate dehydrogenase subunit gamma [Planctomycetota bacterium]
MTPTAPPALPPDAAAAVERALAAHQGRPGALLPILHAVQDALGYVPPDALPRIAHALNLSRADVHGVVTFYHDFRDAPPGRHVVKLCRAEACQAVGSDELVADVCARFGTELGHTRADGAVTLEPVYCLGNCALGPSAMVDGELRGRVTASGLAAELPDVPAARPGGAS